jgi:hypothetical protein
MRSCHVSAWVQAPEAAVGYVAFETMACWHAQPPFLPLVVYPGRGLHGHHCGRHTQCVRQVNRVPAARAARDSHGSKRAIRFRVRALHAGCGRKGQGEAELLAVAARVDKQGYGVSDRGSAQVCSA